jgi:hypothetical protein
MSYLVNGMKTIKEVPSPDSDDDDEDLVDSYD